MGCAQTPFYTNTFCGELYMILLKILCCTWVFVHVYFRDIKRVTIMLEYVPHTVNHAVEYVLHTVTHAVEYILHTVNHPVEYVLHTVNHPVEYVLHTVTHAVEYVPHQFSEEQHLFSSFAPSILFVGKLF